MVNLASNKNYSRIIKQYFSLDQQIRLFQRLQLKLYLSYSFVITYNTISMGDEPKLRLEASTVLAFNSEKKLFIWDPDGQPIMKMGLENYFEQCNATNPNFKNLIGYSDDILLCY